MDESDAQFKYIEALQERIRELHDETLAKASQIDSLTSTNEELREEKEFLEGDLRALQYGYNGTWEERKKLREKNIELEQECEDLRDAYNTCYEETLALRKQIRHLEADLMDFVIECQSLRAERDELSEKIGSLKQELEISRVKQQELTSEMFNLRHQEYWSLLSDEKPAAPEETESIKDEAWVVVGEEEVLSILRHCLGLDGGMRSLLPHRNYYCSSRDNPKLVEMANRGLMRWVDIDWAMYGGSWLATVEGKKMVGLDYEGNS